MIKPQTNFRAADITAKQIAELMAATGLTKTALIAIAIDRMYTQEIREPEAKNESH